MDEDLRLLRPVPPPRRPFRPATEGARIGLARALRYHFFDERPAAVARVGRIARRPARPDLAPIVMEQLPERRSGRRRTLDDRAAVRLPAGERPAAAQHGPLARKRGVSDRMLRRTGVAGVQHERLAEPIRAAQYQHVDRSVDTSLGPEHPDRVACPGEGRERPSAPRPGVPEGARDGAGPAVVAAGRDVGSSAPTGRARVVPVMAVAVHHCTVGPFPCQRDAYTPAPAGRRAQAPRYQLTVERTVRPCSGSPTPARSRRLASSATRTSVADGRPAWNS